MRLLSGGAMIALLLILPNAASFHEGLPLRFDESMPGPGWSLVTLDSGAGEVTFESYVTSSDPHTQRMDVRNASGALALSLEAFSRGGNHGVTVHVISEERTLYATSGSFEGIISTIHVAPECPGTWSLWVGSDGSGMSATLDVSCLGDGPWSILSYGAGDNVESRNVRLRSGSSLSAWSEASGDGAIFVRLEDQVQSASVQANLPALRLGVITGETSAALSGAFVGSFGVFEREAISTASNAQGMRTCPCVFNGDSVAERETWTFGAHGAVGDAAGIYLSGVDLGG